MVVDFGGFAKIPLMDCHVHFGKLGSMKNVLDILGAADFHRMTLLSLASTRFDQEKAPNLNPEAIALKALHPGIFYAFGALDYYAVLRGGRTPSLSDQVDSLERIGFDGVKMVEGKPDSRKALGIKFDDPFFEEYFQRLEERRFPLLFHVADPEEFWDPKTVPSWAKRRGWFYDSTFPSKQQLYEEVGRVLDSHPDLRVIFAHFYFLSANPEAATEFMEKHSCASLDITPGIEMYHNFSAPRDKWREFFMKYQDKILFGTDISSDQSIESAVARVWMIRKFLETDSVFYVPYESDSLLDAGARKPLHGLNLPTEVLEKIYCENFRTLAGFTPKMLNQSLAIEECERLAGEEALMGGIPVESSVGITVANLIRNLPY